jgi:hypothetical protein
MPHSHEEPWLDACDGASRPALVINSAAFAGIPASSLYVRGCAPLDVVLEYYPLIVASLGRLVGGACSIA